MLETTKHAAAVIAERNIKPEWIETALTAPALVQPDADDVELEHRLAVIADCGNRVFHVVVKRNVQPAFIITAYFLRPCDERKAMKLHFDKDADALKDVAVQVA